MPPIFKTIFSVIAFGALYIILYVFLFLEYGCSPFDPIAYFMGKPRTQELVIDYHYLGWGPARERFFFIKRIVEVKKHKWGRFCGSPKGYCWLPTVTKEQYFVSSVTKDGTQLEEAYEIVGQEALEVLGNFAQNARTKEIPHPHPFNWAIRFGGQNSLVFRDGSFLLLKDKTIHRVSREGMRPLATLPLNEPVRGGFQIEVSPSEDRVLVLLRSNLDSSNDGVWIVNVHTHQAEFLPIPELYLVRWAPDGTKFIVISGNAAPSRANPAHGFIKIFDVEKSPVVTIPWMRFPSSFHMSLLVEWTKDGVIWLLTDKDQPVSPHPSTLNIRPMPDTNKLKDHVEYTTVEGWNKVRMGPPGIFGMIAGWPYQSGQNVKLIRVLKSQNARGMDKELVLIFSLLRKHLTVPEEEWDETLQAVTNDHGEMW